jgi:sugar phosphate permease
MTLDAAPALRERWLRIIPAVFLMYTISYFDRVNISLALPSMSRDLGLSPAEAGLAGGIFFWGYLLTFLAAGWLAPRFGPKRAVLWSLLAWGLCAMLTGLVRNANELFVIRFFLGAAEGPVWTSTAMLLSQWFVKSERARAFGLWNLCIPIGALLAGPISGFVLAHWEWRTMLVIEGLPAWIWALVWWRAMPSSLSEAHWLSAPEQQRLSSALASEQAAFAGTAHDPWYSIIRHPTVWLLLGGFSLINMVSYGVTLWLPSAINAMGRVGAMGVGMLSALPYLTAAIGLVVATRSSDHFRERRLHASGAMVMIGLLLLIAANLGGHSILLQMVAFTLMGFFYYMYLPLIFTLATEILPQRTAIPAVAFIGGVGNLFGGFVGPTLVGWMMGLTGDFTRAFSVLAIGGIIGGLLVFMIRRPEWSEQRIAPPVG